LLPRYAYDKGIFDIDPKMIPAPDDARDGRS